MDAPLSRRGFLKVGIAGSLALALAGGIYRVKHHTEVPAAFIFDDQAKAVLRAIVPVMLKDAMDPNPGAVNAAIERVQNAIAGLPRTTQKEIQDLFALLTLSPTRRLLTGISGDWTQAHAVDVAAFLQSWRLHRFGLLQSAYHALHDLITGSWYADDSTWAAIGYPGPIKELS